MQMNFLTGVPKAGSMVDFFDKLEAKVVEVITFVVAGIIFEALYFQVLPNFYSEQHFTWPYALLFWGLLVMIIVAFMLRDLKYALRGGVPFSLGVIGFAYMVADWYSLGVAIAALVVSILLKVYVK